MKFKKKQFHIISEEINSVQFFYEKIKHEIDILEEEENEISALQNILILEDNLSFLNRKISSFQTNIEATKTLDESFKVILESKISEFVQNNQRLFITVAEAKIVVSRKIIKKNNFDLRVIHGTLEKNNLTLSQLSFENIF